MHFPDLSLAVIKLMGPGEYVLVKPNEQAPGPLRPGGAGLHALDRAQPALSGHGGAADAQGPACQVGRALFRR